MRGSTYEHFKSKVARFHVVRIFLGCLRMFGDKDHPIANGFEDVDGLFYQLGLSFGAVLELALRHYGNLLSQGSQCLQVNIPALIMVSIALYSVKSLKSAQDLSRSLAWIVSNR